MNRIRRHFLALATIGLILFNGVVSRIEGARPEVAAGPTAQAASRDSGGRTNVQGKAELLPAHVASLRSHHQARVALDLDSRFKLRKGAGGEERGEERYHPSGIRPPVTRISPRPGSIKEVLGAEEGGRPEPPRPPEPARRPGAPPPPPPPPPRPAPPTGRRTPVAAAGWKAFDAPGDASADANLAVSHTHIVVTSHTMIGFFDKMGTPLKDVYVGDFFSSLNLASMGVDSYFDARSIWDHFRNRFWIGVSAYASQPNQSGKKPTVFACAVSKTENPLDGWYTYWWYAGAGIEDGGDYPCLAVDRTCFIETTGDKSWSYKNVCIFPADPLSKGTFQGGWRFTNLQNPNTGNAPEMIQPVNQHDSTPYTYLVGRDGNQIVLWTVSNQLTPNQELTAKTYTVDIPFTAPPASPQKSSSRTIWSNEMLNFFLKAVLRNGSLYIVADDAKDWFGDGQPLASIRVLKIHLASSAIEIDRIFGKNSSQDDKPQDRVHYSFPSIEVNAKGSMLMVYTRSGETLFPEMRASEWPFNSNDILPSRLMKAGEKPYNFAALTPSKWSSLPWADCAGASVDPSDDSAIWIASCYATSASDNNWAIWVSKIVF
jgi:hypothetical protein